MRNDPGTFKGIKVAAWATTGEGPDRLNAATVQDLATLAGAFAKSNMDLEDRDVANAVETIAWQIEVRHNELPPHSDIKEVPTLARAFNRHEAPHFKNAMNILASELTARRADLLPRAAAEQLATLMEAFGGGDGRDYPRVLLMINEVEQRRSTNRPQLELRERSPLAR